MSFFNVLKWVYMEERVEHVIDPFTFCARDMQYIAGKILKNIILHPYLIAK